MKTLAGRSSLEAPLLRLDDLSVTFAVGRRRLQAVRSVSLSIAKGEMYALVGESGCGKSSIAKTICGLHRPSAGSVSLLGIDVHAAQGEDARTLRRNVQLLFQEALPSLNPRHTIRYLLWEPLKANGLSARPDDAEQAMGDQLNAVGLPRRALDKYPRDFSGGQQQRIALARVLLLRPSLICADEPVSALDVSVQAQIVQLLERSRREQGLTYLLISHDLPLVSQIADRVSVMYLGEIVESGPAADVVSRPLHPYTVALRSATPVARSTQARRPRIVLKGEPPSPLDPPPGCAFHRRCPIARPKCSREQPPLTDRGRNRWVACHFAGELE